MSSAHPSQDRPSKLPSNSKATVSSSESRSASEDLAADKPSSRFSLKWLLRWPDRENGQKSRSISPDANKQKTILKSKTCDNTLSYLSGMSKDSSKISYSSSFFQQLYLRTAKSSSINSCDPSKKMRSSFSSGDVQKYWQSSHPPTIPQSASSGTRDELGLLESKEKVCGMESLLQVKSKAVGSTSQRKCKSRSSTSPASACDAIRDSPSSVMCRLCLSFVSAQDMHQLRECGCKFCIQCLHQYLTINIREGNVQLSCPETHCLKEGKIQPSEVERLVDSSIYEMFKRFKANREVDMDPTRTWCPVPSCSTVCYVRPGSTPNKGTPVFCPTCGFTFCSRCNVRWHASKTCDELQKELKDEKEFALCDEESTPIKRCPFCRIPIERDEGCAQMMCKNCKHVFCWYCLASLDDDFLLRHYDKGPCKNKLGHSRASVVWHRTQVVGIFAGFGFLLLIASPLLLLAAPCLLCCKCNKCIKVFEHEPPVE